MIGLRKTFSRVAACAILTGMLAGYAGAQTLLERIKALPRATDSDIAQMLTTNNDRAVDQELALSYRDVLTVFAQRMTPSASGASEFSIATFREGAQIPTVRKKSYPQFGNPRGILQPTNLIELTDEELVDKPTGRFYLTTFARQSIQRYEAWLEHAQEIARAHGISVQTFLDKYRIDTIPPTVDGKPVGDVAAIRTYLPLGAVLEGMAIDLRVPGEKLVRIRFTSQPPGKQPLPCEAHMPYDLSEGTRVFHSQWTQLYCKLDGKSFSRILTSWEEEAIENHEYAKVHSRARGQGTGLEGFCGAECARAGEGGPGGDPFAPVGGLMPRGPSVPGFQGFQ